MPTHVGRHPGLQDNGPYIVAHTGLWMNKMDSLVSTFESQANHLYNVTMDRRSPGVGVAITAMAMFCDV